MAILVCNSIMRYDGKHPFICLLVICVSLIKCLFRLFAYFLNGLFVFLLSFKSSLYVFANSPFSDIFFAYIFPRSIAFLLTHLTVSHREQKFLNLNEVQFISCLFKDHTFGVASKKLPPNLRSFRLFPSMLSSRSFIISYLHLGLRLIFS